MDSIDKAVFALSASLFILLNMKLYMYISLPIRLIRAVSSLFIACVTFKKGKKLTSVASLMTIFMFAGVH